MVDRLRAITGKRTAPGTWESTTEGSYDQRHAAAKAFEAVMATSAPDNPDIQYSDMSWVRSGFPNVALTGNGPNAPRNASAIVAMDHTYEALLAVASEGRAYRDLVFASASESDQLEAWARFDDALAALDARIAEVTK